MKKYFNDDIKIEEDNNIIKEANGCCEALENFTGKIGEKGSGIQFVNIIGQIEGHMSLPDNNKTTKYEHIIPLLIQMAEDNEVKGVLFVLNTVGGDVEAGLAIAELIATLGKPTVSLVLGGGHSIGVPLAVSTNYSFIAESATMMLHPVRVNGLVIGSEQTYRNLNKTQERIFDFIIKNSNIKLDRLRELMFDTDILASDVGTILYGKEALKEKLIDEVGGLDLALKKLKSLIE
ncbi:MAG: ClpP family protease [Lachnospirales bacterium]